MAKNIDSLRLLKEISEVFLKEKDNLPDPKLFLKFFKEDEKFRKAFQNSPEKVKQKVAIWIGMQTPGEYLFEPDSF
jgi:hypothetical protein